MSSLQSQVGTSLHHQVSTLIKDGIATGRYLPGDQLPTEESLCSMYGVSRVTVRRAMESLKQQGLVQRQRGKGTYVCESASVLSLPTPLDNYLQRIAEQRAKSRPVVKSFGFVLAPPDVRLALSLPDKAKVLRVVRIRIADHLPLMFSTVHLEPNVGSRLTKALFGRLSLTEALAAVGERYSRIEVVTRARLADPSLASALQVDLGSALVDVLRVGYNAEGAAIEHQTILGPSDRFQSRVTIRG